MSLGGFGGGYQPRGTLTEEQKNNPPQGGSGLSFYRPKAAAGDRTARLKHAIALAEAAAICLCNERHCDGGDWEAVGEVIAHLREAREKLK